MTSGHEYIGLTVDAAKQKAREAGLDFCVTSNDGKHYAIVAMFDTARIVAHVRGGVVVAADRG